MISQAESVMQSQGIWSWFNMLYASNINDVTNMLTWNKVSQNILYSFGLDSVLD